MLGVGIFIPLGIIVMVSCTRLLILPVNAGTTLYSTAMESLQKKLAAARAAADYDTMEVVQKTIEAVQSRFSIEVNTTQLFVLQSSHLTLLCATLLQKDKFDRANSRQLAVNRRMRESNTLRDMAAGNR